MALNLLRWSAAVAEGAASKRLLFSRHKLKTTIVYLSFAILFITTSCAEIQKRNNLEKLEFTQVTYTQESLDKFPFLKTKEEFVEATRSPDHREPSVLKVYIATLDDPLIKDTVLLVLYEGFASCGTHGCSFSGYRLLKSEKFQRLGMDLIVNRPIYKLHCTQKLFLITSGGGGQSPGFAKWFYDNGNLVLTAKSADIASLSSCGNNS